MVSAWIPGIGAGWRTNKMVRIDRLAMRWTGPVAEIAQMAVTPRREGAARACPHLARETNR